MAAGHGHLGRPTRLDFGLILRVVEFVARRLRIMAHKCVVSISVAEGQRSRLKLHDNEQWGYTTSAVCNPQPDNRSFDSRVPLAGPAAKTLTYLPAMSISPCNCKALDKRLAIDRHTQAAREGTSVAAIIELSKIQRCDQQGNHAYLSVVTFSQP